MKISNYVTKYDYIAYYTKQKAMWFFTNAEVEASFQTQMKLAQEELKKSSLKNSQIIADEEYEEGETDDNEFDSYNLYRELLEENQNIDRNNYRIVEGLKIDAMSKKHIYEYYKNMYTRLFDPSTNQNDFYLYDFDEQHMSLEDNAQKTLMLINNYPYVIIYQPAFIDHDLNIATKCDALVKFENRIYLVETKATSTAKFHHYLDLFFQKRIIEKVLKDFNYEYRYRLCLIKYEPAQKNTATFIISKTINLKKQVSVCKQFKDDLEMKQKIKLGQEYSCGRNEYPNYYLDDLLSLDFSFIPDKMLVPTNSKVDKFKLLTNLHKNFDYVINELWDHKKQLMNQKESCPGSFIPSYNDKGDFKNTDLWLTLRKLYAVKGYKAFEYSGNVIDFSPQNMDLFGKTGPHVNLNLISFLRHRDSRSGTAAAANEYHYFHKNSPEFYVDNSQYEKLMSQLKPQKVYFDFESINPCIRVIDGSLPFTQIVTQNSVIKDHGVNQEKYVCENLMIDPNQIDLDWFKKIINSIYEGPNYSYIVYNKVFESNRLLEMASFINEKEYDKKVKVINDNMFDLADFFKITSKKEIIFIKQLHGFYSIKCVLPLIEQYAPYIFEQTNCQNYKTLEIGNGLECQTQTMSRFYNCVSDDAWKKIEAASKIYCENDVRAMIAVERFVKMLKFKYNDHK